MLLASCALPTVLAPDQFPAGSHRQPYGVHGVVGQIRVHHLPVNDVVEFTEFAASAAELMAPSEI